MCLLSFPFIYLAVPDLGKIQFHFRTVYGSNPAFIDHGRLFPYQLDGLNFLHSAWEQRTNVILAGSSNFIFSLGLTFLSLDEMGLGKTIQTIAYMLSIRHIEGKSSPAFPFIVVAPLSVVENWILELRRWAPHFNCVQYTGGMESRKMLRKYELQVQQGVLVADVVVTNYEVAINDSFLIGIRWEVSIHSPSSFPTLPLTSSCFTCCTSSPFNLHSR